MWPRRVRGATRLISLAFGFDDIFESIFGGFGTRAPATGAARAARRPRYDLTINLRKAASRRRQGSVRHTRHRPCPTSVAAAPSRPPRCAAPNCSNGSGECRQVRQTFLGSMVTSPPAPPSRARARPSPPPATPPQAAPRCARPTQQLSVTFSRPRRYGTRFRRSRRRAPGLNCGPTQPYARWPCPAQVLPARASSCWNCRQTLAHGPRLGTDVTVPTVTADRSKYPPATQPRPNPPSIGAARSGRPAPAAQCPRRYVRLVTVFPPPPP